MSRVETEHLNGCFIGHHYAYLFILLKKRKIFLVTKLCHLACIKNLILDPVYVYIKMCSTASHKDRLVCCLHADHNQPIFIYGKYLINYCKKQTNKGS